MTRLIDADSLLEELDQTEWRHIKQSIITAPTVQREAINEVYEFEKWLKENTLIRANLNIELDYADPLAEIAYKAWQARSKLNLQTVQREGWVRVEELQKVYDDMFKHKDIAISANSLFKLIQAAPTDTEY